ncbi:hypothetical protein [Streptomyces sp. NPDC102282]|uniref:hypothetical protein n=1 Tax=Streptomyces sp. NPDC102282 TaxID=3366154 RepID=UPI003816FEFE
MADWVSGSADEAGFLGVESETACAEAIDFLDNDLVAGTLNDDAGNPAPSKATSTTSR